MAVPDYQSLMLPVLKAAAEKSEINLADCREKVATILGLTPADLAEQLPYERQSTFINRMSWAKTYMERAGLIETIRRGLFRATLRGQAILKENPQKIDVTLLRRYPEFIAWQDTSRTTSSTKSAPSKPEISSSAQTPEERMASAHAELTDALRSDLLQRMMAAPPQLFEQLVVDLLLALGYGDGRREMGEALGRSGDGGIDGIIKEDALGLDAVYIQAKRYGRDNTVGSEAIRNFMGSMTVKHATKGVFATTSSFTKDAKLQAAATALRIVLIDGDELTRLMVAHNVGVRIRESYEMKKIDEDYFEE